MKKNEIIVKANLFNVPAEMVKASENLQNVLNSMNASKKQLARASYELKVQASECKTSFKDFIKNHFAMFDISDSRLYALAQTAETFDTEELKDLWERIPVSKLEKMTRIKKAKSNNSAMAFGYIPFLQCVSYRSIELHNTACENTSKMIAELNAQLDEAYSTRNNDKINSLSEKLKTVESSKKIEIPKDEKEQKTFYLNDGISRICAMTDSKIGDLVKLYNLYSDVVKPETGDSNSDNNGNNNNDDNNDDNNKEKSVFEMIADILTKVQTLREKAKSENVELPETTIKAFIECMENFGK